VPLLWGAIKLVKSTSTTRMHLINDFLFKGLGSMCCYTLIEEESQVMGSQR
jgi:hypothetical protein